MGRHLPLDRPEVLAEELDRFAAMPPPEHDAMCARARAYGLPRLEARDEVAATKPMFDQVMA